jgi:hypothetical protein
MKHRLTVNHKYRVHHVAAYYGVRSREVLDVLYIMWADGWTPKRYMTPSSALRLADLLALIDHYSCLKAQDGASK